MIAATDDRELLLRRLRWRCRRGLLELDLLFGAFLARRIDSFDAESLENLTRLLEIADQTILAWVQGSEPVPDEFKSIISDISQYIDNKDK